MAFDPKWPHGHVTRAGNKARVICSDAIGAHPIVALVVRVDGTGSERVLQFYPNGEHPERKLLDLVNAPDPNELRRWVNIYPDGFVGVGTTTREIAEKRAGCLGRNWLNRRDCRLVAYRDGKIVDITDDEA